MQWNVRRGTFIFIYYYQVQLSLEKLKIYAKQELRWLKSNLFVSFLKCIYFFYIFISKPKKRKVDILFFFQSNIESN